MVPILRPEQTLTEIDARWEVQRIRALVFLTGRRIVDVALASGLSPERARRILRNERRPTRQEIAAIARAVGTVVKTAAGEPKLTADGRGIVATCPCCREERCLLVQFGEPEGGEQ